MTVWNRRADLVHAAHVAHGAALLLRPAVVAARLDGSGDARVVAVVRVLGARHLLQGLVGLVVPGRVSTMLGAAVDAAHGASMAGLAVLDREHRRGAAASAATALVFGLVGAWAARGR